MWFKRFIVGEPKFKQSLTNRSEAHHTREERGGPCDLAKSHRLPAQIELDTFMEVSSKGSGWLGFQPGWLVKGGQAGE